MGGASLIVNTTTSGIDYVILKNIVNESRTKAAIETATNLSENSLRATYFGADASLAEPFAAVHEQEDE